MATTCDPCLSGKHFRCDRDGCACSLCLLKRKPRVRARELEPIPKPPPKLPPEDIKFRKATKQAEAAERVIERAQVAGTPKEPRRRSYDDGMVRVARDMKAAGATWKEIASHFGVPKEGIRYAILHYEQQAMTEPVEPKNMKRVSVTLTLAGVLATLILNEDELAEAHLAVSDLATGVQRAVTELEGETLGKARRRLSVLLSLQTAFAEAVAAAVTLRKEGDGG